jgi:hypothetical protein
MILQNTNRVLVLTWEGSLVFLQMFLLNGGPTGMFAAFPIVTVGVLTQVLVMAEMASMYVPVRPLPPYHPNMSQDTAIGWRIQLGRNPRAGALLELSKLLDRLGPCHSVASCLRLCDLDQLHHYPRPRTSQLSALRI